MVVNTGYIQHRKGLPQKLGSGKPATFFLLYISFPRAVGISMRFIQVRPPGYFTHVSITTPIVPALKNYYR
jgi:hypothetical protein